MYIIFGVQDKKYMTRVLRTLRFCKSLSTSIYGTVRTVVGASHMCLYKVLTTLLLPKKYN